MSCDGYSIAAVGATQPTVESLRLGSVPGMPKLVLHHPVLAVEAGEAFMERFHKCITRFNSQYWVMQNELRHAWHAAKH